MTTVVPAEIGVVIVHGMGNPEPGFADALINGLSRTLGDDAPAVAFEPCFWSDILQSSEDEIWRRLRSAQTPMHLHAIRRVLVGTLGDPTGYLSGYARKGVPVMHTVHRRLAAALGAVERRVADPAAAPVVVLAHSLGCVVVTNYLWNLERAAGEVGAGSARAADAGENNVARRAIGDTPVQRLETLAGLVTFGCNIPLFLPPEPPYECVRFPRPGLPKRLQRTARWMNVYDPDDVLGFPLNELWDRSHGTRIVDVALDVGMPAVSVTPFSHAAYWRDDGFQDLVAAELRRVLAAARETVPRA